MYWHKLVIKHFFRFARLCDFLRLLSSLPLLKRSCQTARDEQGISKGYAIYKKCQFLRLVYVLVLITTQEHVVLTLVVSLNHVYSMKTRALVSAIIITNSRNSYFDAVVLVVLWSFYKKCAYHLCICEKCITFAG